MSLLSLTNVTASYGASQVLFDVNLDVGAGQVMALMGRNGMGKTTTVRTICRMMPANGRLVFDGNDLARLPSHRAARLGIGLVPEGRRCFRDLSVRENLIAAAKPGEWSLSTVTELLPRLGERLGQRAVSLSGGEQQMLAIGRALMTNPRLLILDEATEGLAPIIRQEIWAAISDLKARTGLAILVIDKSVRELSAVADAVTILERGATVWQGPVGDMTPEIARKYIGI